MFEFLITVLFLHFWTIMSILDLHKMKRNDLQKTESILFFGLIPLLGPLTALLFAVANYKIKHIFWPFHWLSRRNFSKGKVYRPTDILTVEVGKVISAATSSKDLYYKGRKIEYSTDWYDNAKICLKGASGSLFEFTEEQLRFLVPLYHEYKNSMQKVQKLSKLANAEEEAERLLK